MARTRTTKFTWVATAVILLGIGYFGWSMFALHVHDPGRAVTPAEAAAFASIPIPPEATNVRYAGYSQAVEYVLYVRFEAPVDVCLKTAAAIVPGQQLKPVDEYELRARAMPLRKDVLRNFEWFDLASATDVVSAGGGSHLPQVWVDRTRGVLYYRLTD